jgi:hypothetical protein
MDRNIRKYLWLSVAAIAGLLLAKKSLPYIDAYVGDDGQQVLKLNPFFANEPMADRSYAIRRLGGKVVDPRSYPYTLDGFQAYLDAVGVNRQWSSARELTQPNHPSIAAKYGYRIFLPPQVWWQKGAAVALMQNRLRELVGGPIRIRNWWRPKGYNEDAVVGGAPTGDHPDGDGADFDFQSEGAKWKGCKYAFDMLNSEPRMGISLGIYSGPLSLHFGVNSRGGRRTWDHGRGGEITQSKIDNGLRYT